MVVLFGGTAGSGKTTVARIWCKSRLRAVHIQLDEVRNLIISGLVNPQFQTPEQGTQYAHSVAACVALARSFNRNGYDVALDDVFEHGPTRELWLPLLSGLDTRLVILHPSLEITLARNTERGKTVLQHHIRSQHASMNDWQPSYKIDNGALTPEETLEWVNSILDSVIIRQ